MQSYQIIILVKRDISLLYTSPKKREIFIQRIILCTDNPRIVPTGNIACAIAQSLDCAFVVRADPRGVVLDERGLAR